MPERRLQKRDLPWWHLGYRYRVCYQSFGMERYVEFHTRRGAEKFMKGRPPWRDIKITGTPDA